VALGKEKWPVGRVMAWGRGKGPEEGEAKEERQWFGRTVSAEEGVIALGEGALALELSGVLGGHWVRGCMP
jgi:hypothetical protein